MSTTQHYQLTDFLGLAILSIGFLICNISYKVFQLYHANLPPLKKHVVNFMYVFLSSILQLINIVSTTCLVIQILFSKTPYLPWFSMLRTLLFLTLSMTLATISMLRLLKHFVYGYYSSLPQDMIFRLSICCSVFPPFITCIIILFSCGRFEMDYLFQYLKTPQSIFNTCFIPTTLGFLILPFGIISITNLILFCYLKNISSSIRNIFKSSAPVQHVSISFVSNQVAPLPLPPSHLCLTEDSSQPAVFSVSSGFITIILSSMTILPSLYGNIIWTLFIGDFIPSLAHLDVSSIFSSLITILIPLYWINTDDKLCTFFKRKVKQMSLESFSD